MKGDKAALSRDVPPSGTEHVRADAVLQHSAPDAAPELHRALTALLSARYAYEANEGRTARQYWGTILHDYWTAQLATIAAPLLAAPHQNADQPKAAPQAPCTPRRSSPGLAERPDSPNGVSLERAAILDETDSGVKPAGVAPRVGEDEVIERCAKLIEEHYWDSFQNDRRLDAHVKSLAKMIRALKSKQEGDNAALPPDVPPSDGALVRVNDKG
jgi:hypothetical protein